MNENDSKDEPLLDQFRRVLKDGIDYGASVLSLLQARLAEYFISTILLVFLLGFASLLIIAAFILLNVALGMWLSQALGNPLWAVLILSAVYGILAAALAWSALRWFQRLKS